MLRVGLEMFTVRHVFAEDPIGTLEKVAAAGYKGIELFNHKEDKLHGLYGLDISMTPLDFKRTAKGLGLEVVGYQPVAEDPEDPTYLASQDVMDRLIGFCCEVGSKTLAACCEFYSSKDYLLRRCEVFNKLGEKCNKAGLRFVYHNHYNDFQLFDDQTMFDVVMKNVLSENMGIELCVYWTIMGLVDPVKKIREYAGRVEMVHEKDWPLEYVHELNVWKKLDRNVPIDYKTFKSVIKPEHFTEVGEGIIKVQDVIDACNDVGAKYILVEQDYTRLNEIDSMNLSIANMRKMRGLKWD
jgi:sugar phosphate isomerase/epimerase